MSTPPGSSTLRHDAIAGVTASAVVLPMAMAYASIAGLPLAIGLYTALLPMVIYALLGSSRVLSVSSTSTLAILTASQLALIVPDGNPARLTLAVATLSALIGAILLLAAVLRLGFVANFISAPVLTGFKSGVGLVIALDQLPKMLGIRISKHGFFHDLLSIAERLTDLSLPTVLVSAATLLILLGVQRWRPQAPAPLLAVGGGIAASWLLNLQAHGVATVGLIPQGFPALTLPDALLIHTLLPGALGIALMSFTESIAAARAFAGHNDSPIKANRELAALGLANLGGALFGGMPAGGGTSQTAVVRAAGGLSQKASLVTAGLAIATMLLLAPLLGLLPYATLAGVVIVYSAKLIQPAEFLNIRKIRNMEFGWALAAGLGVLIFGTLHGIEIAIIVSLIGLASQTANPSVYALGRKRDTDVLRPLSAEHADDETYDGLLIVRPEGRLFFINAQNVAEQINALITLYQPRVVAVDMSGVPDIEYSALQMLIEGEHRIAERGMTLWLAGLNPAVLETVRHSGLADRLGRERMLFNAFQAIERYQAQASRQSSAEQPLHPPLNNIQPAN